MHFWWEVVDSNYRNPKVADLQSAAIAAMRTSHFSWWTLSDSNRGPSRYERDALTY